jgi:hypothetical protein
VIIQLCRCPRQCGQASGARVPTRPAGKKTSGTAGTKPCLRRAGNQTRRAYRRKDNSQNAWRGLQYRSEIARRSSIVSDLCFLESFILRCVWRSFFPIISHRNLVSLRLRADATTVCRSKGGGARSSGSASGCLTSRPAEITEIVADLSRDVGRSWFPVGKGCWHSHSDRKSFSARGHACTQAGRTQEPYP